MVQKITEAIEVVVGKYYLVPHAVIDSCGVLGYKKGDLVPLLFPAHEDKELGLPILHYHFDTRFLPVSKLERKVDLQQKDGTKAKISLYQAHVIKATSVKEIVWKKRRCLRSPAAFPYNDTINPVLEPLYQDAIAGDVCPHRGISLVGCPVEGEARVCPGHGLRWHINTGKLLTDHECLSTPQAN